MSYQVVEIITRTDVEPHVLMATNYLSIFNTLEEAEQVAKNLKEVKDKKMSIIKYEYKVNVCL